jgi:amino acid transporter
MIEFEGQLDENGFRQAQWLSTPGLVRWMGWLIAAALVMVLATGGLQPMLREPVQSAITLVVMAAFAIFMIVAPRRAITKTWQNTPLLHERVTGYLSEAGVRFQSSSNDTTLTWDKLVKQRVSNDLILLYTSARAALILPRSYFRTDEDWAAARALVTRNLPAK